MYRLSELNFKFMCTFFQRNEKFSSVHTSEVVQPQIVLQVAKTAMYYCNMY